MQNMTPVAWAIRPLRKYATFKGRAPRAEFWWFNLFIFIGGALFDAFDRATGLEVIGPLFSLAILLPFLAVAVRRLHDLDRTGWWLVAPLLPVILMLFLSRETLNERLGWDDLASPPGLMLIAFFLALILQIVFWATRGTPGPNRFGPDPYRPDDAQVAPPGSD